MRTKTEIRKVLKRKMVILQQTIKADFHSSFVNKFIM